MNRCNYLASPDRRTLTQRATSLLVGALLCALAPATFAQNAPPRPFPAKAQRGVMVVVQPPELLINDRPERLSPGARIRGPNNMMVMSGALVGQKLLVHYVREPLGLIHEVWILTEAEAALELPKPAPN